MCNDNSDFYIFVRSLNKKIMIYRIIRVEYSRKIDF